MKNTQKLRHLIQLASAVLTDGYAKGFAKGVIFTGKSKMLCVPVLNCYSCPGALGACPIGSLQAVLGSNKFNMSFYVLGLLMLFGMLLGRIVCGFLCPFGFIQELLHKIPLPKLTVKKELDKPLRLLKYLVLAALIILPIAVTNPYGIAPPYFCQWVCPAGTLEGGIPLLIKNEGLRRMVGFLFSWKCAILIVVVLLSTVIYRPFCKYLCPLGAFYGLFNKLGFARMEVNGEKCVQCGNCERSCPMQVDVRKNINSAECIRCGKCSDACPTDAIRKCFSKAAKETAEI